MSTEGRRDWLYVGGGNGWRTVRAAPLRRIDDDLVEVAVVVTALGWSPPGVQDLVTRGRLSTRIALRLEAVWDFRARLSAVLQGVDDFLPLEIGGNHDQFDLILASDGDEGQFVAEIKMRSAGLHSRVQVPVDVACLDRLEHELGELLKACPAEA